MSNSMHRAVPPDEAMPELVDQIGRLTRTVFSCINDLKLDKTIGQAAGNIADGRDGLANTIDPVADRAQSAIEQIASLQDAIERRASALDGRWNQWFAAPIEFEQARSLVADTRDYLQWVPEQAGAAKTKLGDMSRPRDLSDATAQVDKKLIATVVTIERELVKLLQDHAVRERDAKDARAACEAAPSRDQAPVNDQHSANALADRARIAEFLNRLGY